MHPEATTPKRKKEDQNDEKNKKVKNSEAITSVPSTPTSAANKTPKTPREKFDLPEGFTVVEKKTEKKSWKEYQGPDGKIIK